MIGIQINILHLIALTKFVDIGRFIQNKNFKTDDNDTKNKHKMAIISTLFVAIQSLQICTKNLFVDIHTDKTNMNCVKIKYTCILTHRSF